ncbi:MAG: hypothetical protein HQL54_10720 [Magnetococcales bacterium]|nr:hypothetical protein [Magnetococcales bacterium]
MSGHGFGHFAQVAPVIGQLHQRCSNLQLHISCALPRSVLSQRLSCAFSHTQQAYDVGLVQPDPMIVDLDATAEALRQKQANRTRDLEALCSDLSDWKPDLVLADIPDLPLAAAQRLKIPSVAIASLTWVDVIQAYFPNDDPQVQGWLDTMRESYAAVTMALRPEPVIVAELFDNPQPIPAIVEPGRNKRLALRGALGIGVDDARPLVLVSLGGIPSQQLPLDQLARERGYYWIMDRQNETNRANIFSASSVSGFTFADISASVDAVVGKPGYNMTVESVAHGVPFLYVCRGTFPDEAPLCAWLDRYGRGLELDTARFSRGEWADGLNALLHRKQPEPPPLNGAEVAAQKCIDLI